MEREERLIERELDIEELECIAGGVDPLGNIVLRRLPMTIGQYKSKGMSRDDALRTAKGHAHRYGLDDKTVESVFDSVW